MMIVMIIVAISSNRANKLYYIYIYIYINYTTLYYNIM